MNVKDLIASLLVVLILFLNRKYMIRWLTRLYMLWLARNDEHVEVKREWTLY